MTGPRDGHTGNKCLSVSIRLTRTHRKQVVKKHDRFVRHRFYMRVSLSLSVRPFLIVDGFLRLCHCLCPSVCLVPSLALFVSLSIMGIAINK